MRGVSTSRQMRRRTAGGWGEYYRITKMLVRSRFRRTGPLTRAGLRPHALKKRDENEGNGW